MSKRAKKNSAGVKTAAKNMIAGNGSDVAGPQVSQGAKSATTKIDATAPLSESLSGGVNSDVTSLLGGTRTIEDGLSGLAGDVATDEVVGPVEFATDELGLTLYPWQEEVLGWYENTCRRTMGALVTPNGAGKSSKVVAALALWWASVHPRGRVVITTKDGKQLEQQLYPALAMYRSRLHGWRWTTSPYTEIETPRGGRIVAFTTNDAGRAEGWHKEDDLLGPLLMIVDEAKSVEEPIFQAIDRCTFNALLYVSSPGVMMGAFYHAFTRNAALFRRRQVGLRECPHIAQERIDGMYQGHDSLEMLIRPRRCCSPACGRHCQRLRWWWCCGRWMK